MKPKSPCKRVLFYIGPKRCIPSRSRPTCPLSQLLKEEFCFLFCKHTELKLQTTVCRILIVLSEEDITSISYNTFNSRWLNLSNLVHDEWSPYCDLKFGVVVCHVNPCISERASDFGDILEQLFCNLQCVRRDVLHFFASALLLCYWNPPRSKVRRLEGFKSFSADQQKNHAL